MLPAVLPYARKIQEHVKCFIMTISQFHSFVLYMCVFPSFENGLLMHDREWVCNSVSM